MQNEKKHILSLILYFSLPQIVYSSLYEIVVDFTRDYESIRVALQHIEHYDKTCVENMLQAVKTMLTNWGSQNYAQVLVFSDLSLGLGITSVRALIESLEKDQGDSAKTPRCLPISKCSKLSFVCLGDPDESYFQCSMRMHQRMLDVSGQMGQLFVAAAKRVRSGNATAADELKDCKGDEHQVAALAATSEADAVRSVIAEMCEANYKQFEATLKCGGFGKLETAISIWPAPMVSRNNIKKR